MFEYDYGDANKKTSVLVPLIGQCVVTGLCGRCLGGPSLGLNASNCLEQKRCFSFKDVSIVYFGGLKKKPVRVV